ncbi:glucose-6-phosphate exchanger SLC37A4-like isoform X1 [Ostrea edulis]|uniref:glucose-6-phosphate exchanger SLC37A4-like isoform X1 n=1 Tax=Ostrea edulis TaxID=37623 RepID=UPI0024AF5B23|nr:glucose-6-phosphate exchanger SLC37A4-like isoform X1 [Ostrea edulis]
MGRLSGPQLVTFTSVYVAYTLYVYVRRSFSYTIPILASEGTLDKKQLGVIVSSQSLAYTISKFCCGILGDIVSPRLLLSAGLVCSGITAIIFTGFDSVLLLSLWWFLNGLTHGAGWPSIAIILKAWTNPDQFGTVWSVVSTSMNLAGTVGPIVTTLLVTKLGWRYCIQIAGVLSITVGFLCLLIVKDKPGTNANKLKDMDNKKKEDKPAESNVSRKDLLFLPGFLGICMCYLVTALVLHGILQWSQLFMVHEKHQSVLTGSGFLSSVDIGGFVGSFVAGYLSDYMVSKNSSVSRPVIRKTLVLYFEILLGCVLYIFTIHISESSSNVIVTLVGFLIGVGIYGSISLFGVIAMETAPDKIAGTAHAISSIFSNMGLMLAGFPLSFISSLLDWQTTFLILVSTVTIVVTYLLLKLRTELSTFKSTSGKTLNLYNVLFSR